MVPVDAYITQSLKTFLWISRANINLEPSCSSLRNPLRILYILQLFQFNYSAGYCPLLDLNIASIRTNIYLPYLCLFLLELLIDIYLSCPNDKVQLQLAMANYSLHSCSLDFTSSSICARCVVILVN